MSKGIATEFKKRFNNVSKLIEKSNHFKIILILNHLYLYMHYLKYIQNY